MTSSTNYHDACKPGVEVGFKRKVHAHLSPGASYEVMCLTTRGSPMIEDDAGNIGFISNEFWNDGGGFVIGSGDPA
ncbi:hypothetical protein [Asaia astilbis]|uniref:hypothetical protein n=1 Tax=Asaia astilbis TaxID=610244 RepID=UPI000471B5F2|nr:hypothetical protein [Asaia astilbis]